MNGERERGSLLVSAFWGAWAWPGWRWHGCPPWTADQPDGPSYIQCADSTPDRQREPAGKRATNEGDGRGPPSSARGGWRGRQRQRCESWGEKRGPCGPCPSRRLDRAQIMNALPLVRDAAAGQQSLASPLLCFVRLRGKFSFCRRRMVWSIVARGCAHYDLLVVVARQQTLPCSVVSESGLTVAKLASAFLHGSTASANGSGCLRSDAMSAMPLVGVGIGREQLDRDYWSAKFTSLIILIQ